MARPIKNNADYFPHQTKMRNDSKILALRRKYGMEGYAVYNMLIEVLTESEGFRWSRSPMSLEIIAGDFGIDKSKLEDMFNYMEILDLIQDDGKEISCNTLNKALSPLLSKREYDRERLSGGYRNDNSQYSKVEESRVKDNTQLYSLSKAVFQSLRRKGTNTQEITYMVAMWLKEGYKPEEILPQLEAMKAVYQKENLVFPSRILTLTESFKSTDWVEKLKSLNPERIAENIQKQENGIRQQQPDTIGSSKPGSLG